MKNLLLIFVLLLVGSCNENKTPNRDDVVSGSLNTDSSSLNDNGYRKLYNFKKQLSKIGTFKNNRLTNGLWYKYNENDSLDFIEIYEDGKLVRTSLNFDTVLYFEPNYKIDDSLNNNYHCGTPYFNNLSEKLK